MIEITAKKKYGDRVVLDVSNLQFVEGKCYALIGANGSGKSTLLKFIDKQLKASGERVIEKYVAVGYMPQASYAFSMSVKQNILLPCKMMERKAQRCRLNYLVDKLDLKSLLRKNAAKLSGGETQRMALARALMVHSDLLLLDEPTAAMDVEQAKAVIELLKEENQNYENTIIFATHSLKQAEALADEVLFLSNGKVVERDIPSKILHEPQSDEARAFISFNT